MRQEQVQITLNPPGPAALGRREIIRLAKLVFIFGGSAIGGWDTPVVKGWITDCDWCETPELLDDETMYCIMDEAVHQGHRAARFLGAEKAL